MGWSGTFPFTVKGTSGVLEHTANANIVLDCNPACESTYALVTTSESNDAPCGTSGFGPLCTGSGPAGITITCTINFDIEEYDCLGAFVGIVGSGSGSCEIHVTSLPNSAGSCIATIITEFDTFEVTLSYSCNCS